MTKIHNTDKPFCNSDQKYQSEPHTKSNPEYCSEPVCLSTPRKISDETKQQIRQLIEIYYDVQDVRIRSYNRLRTVGEVQGIHPEHLKKLEQEIKIYIQNQIRNIPIYKNYLKNIKGLGAILSGGLIAYFNPYKAEHASSFWRYAGLHVKEGKAIKRQKGQKTDYNPKLRTLCWKIGRAFLMSKNPTYTQIYLEARKKETEKLNNPIENPANCPYYKECQQKLQQKAKRIAKQSKTPPCKLHIHFRALRKMVKLFLADFWAEWRRQEALPVTEPYAIAILKHSKSDKKS